MGRGGLLFLSGGLINRIGYTPAMAVATCERMLEFVLPAGEYSVIDTAFALSQINRRSYRQGYEFAYDKAEIFQTDPASQATVLIHRLPNTWVTVNAWVKAYHNWKGQQDDAMEEGDLWSMRARYRDFKVCYNHGHLAGDFAGVTVSYPTPQGALTLAQAQALDPGAAMEWEYSEFVIPNYGGAGGVTEEKVGYILGDDAVPGFGIIKAYAESRARPHPEDPSTVVPGGATDMPGGIYAEMHDVGEDLDEIMENVTERNTSPPYIIANLDNSREFYPGGSEADYGGHGVQMDTMIVRASSFLSNDSMGPFTALCGLIWIFNQSEANVTLRLWVSAGPYKGVAARPMSEAN